MKKLCCDHFPLLTEVFLLPLLGISLYPLFSIVHIPKLSLNIFSVNQITDHDCLAYFVTSFCYVQEHRTRTLIGRGHKQGGLYYIDRLNLVGYKVMLTRRLAGEDHDLTRPRGDHHCE